MANTKTPRRRRQPATTPKSRGGRSQATAVAVPVQAAAPEAPVLEAAALAVYPEADPHLADAADRAADLRDQAADAAARILADGRERAAELLDSARTEAASITEAATTEQTRLLAVAATDADQVRNDAATAADADAQQVLADAEAKAEQLLADARSEADALATAATGRADQVLADARRQAHDVVTEARTAAGELRSAADRDAVTVRAGAKAQRTELLADADRTASETRTRATTDAEHVLQRARTDADRMRESADGQAAQVRAGAEKVAAGLRQDADRALADARATAEELRAGVDKDIARLREQADADAMAAREAVEKATADQIAAAQARAEGERVLDAATQRTVQRARRREIRTESRAARRKARNDARPAGGVPPLSGGELVGVVAIVLAAAAVSTIGLLSSYTALETKAAGWGWEWPWLLPVGIDVSIPAFTGASLVLIRMGMELRWIRWVPRTLTAVTVYLNWHASDSMSGRLGHAALTLLWVVFSEIASHVYATRIGAVTGKVRMETVRRSRWILAPIPTARLRRRMILWEITSYEEALTRLQEQTYLRAQLKEEHGLLWRWKAPLEQRMTLKLGELPAALADTLTPEDAHTIERAEESEHAHPEVSALTSGEVRGERERPALTSGAHESERAREDGDAQRAEGALTRSESDALTERRHARIRRLYTELGRRPEWTEIRDALTQAGLSDKPVSRPTAQRLREQVEKAAPGA
ncbi:DUF2637 domain-containing protein [Streptomyces geranii]|uniref:DUF2637 domain-containing protein n=1 Tax=Streptomyces geranii TaxID=2058923 RepID=UPI000D03E366|nr:DUF2637 domain-containing protein [Streptomyces geranii]